MDISCGLLIKQINDKLEKDANNALRRQDLTLAQVTALTWLGGRPNKTAALKELERELGVAQSTTAGIITRLEQKDFVESFGDNDDKRIKMVRLTQKGEQKCLSARQNMDAAEKKLLSGLDEEEKAAFHRLLRQVRNNFEPA